MIYVFLADGFEEIEALAVVDVLRRAEMDVVTVGVPGKKVTGSHNITVEADIDIKETHYLNLQGIVLPGGMPGTLNLENHPIVQLYIDYCDEKQLPMFAICAAPSILGKRGLLKGKKATCFPGFEQFLEGAELSDSHVCRDGNIITARGMGVAVDFGIEIVRYFCGDHEADHIRKALQCI